MKITIVLADIHAARQDFIEAQIASTPQKRSVTIELTPEQIASIGLREVGRSYSKRVFEEIFDVFVESEPAP